LFTLRVLQLFRRFAAHLDNQAKKAPQLSEAFASASSAASTDYGKAEGSMAFLSRFRFLEVVGAGSYSTVHRAIEKSTGRPVAIKVIKKEILSPDVEAQILNEAVRVVTPCIWDGCFAGFPSVSAVAFCCSHRISLF
jgi:hypothetical protein